jgi:hypothetical protein
MTAEVTEHQTLEDRYPIPEGKTGIMHALCDKGDIPYMWNRKDRDEVSAAEETFNSHIARGYLAYRAEGKDGHAGEVLRKFDPKAERIIFVKQHVGG